MDETIYTPTQISALPLGALTPVVWAFGLAPEGTYLADWHGRTLYLRDGHPYWEPHARLEQAREVFDGLRARGWRCATTADARGGSIQASLPGQGKIRVLWGPLEPYTETHALLLCAVLAVLADTHEGKPHA